jgi:hypothetical protein
VIKLASDQASTGGAAAAAATPVVGAAARTATHGAGRAGAHGRGEGVAGRPRAKLTLSADAMWNKTTLAGF